MPRPYLGFIVLFALTAAYLFGNARWFDWRMAHQNDHVDMATHTWKPDYDWRAEDRLSERLDRVGHGLVVAVALFAVLDCGYALWRSRNDKRHLIAAAVFAALALGIGLVLSLAGIGGGMIG